VTRRQMPARGWKLITCFSALSEGALSAKRRCDRARPAGRVRCSLPAWEMPCECVIRRCAEWGTPGSMS
jgi:hypothetical protein